MLGQPTRDARELLVERSDFRFEFSECMQEVAGEIRDALLSGTYINSWEVERFEAAFASYLGCTHAVGVNSGTDALQIALEALNVGPGDEVITTANTFHATVLAIVRTGATPVLVDARMSDAQMNLEAVEERIRPTTKAVIAVHLWGMPLDLRKLKQVCSRRGLYLVEDCSQATGARTNGQYVGTTGHVGCFSFHPSKNLGAAGDAGAIVTSDDSVAAKARSLRYFGQRRPKVHSEIGHNSKLDALQAIVLFHKLRFLEQWNKARRLHAERYVAELNGLPLRFPSAQSDGHVYHLFQVCTHESVRDRLLAHLVDRRIDAVVRYPVPIHLQPAFSGLAYTPGAFPVAEQLALTTLCLPLRPNLQQTELQIVVGAVRAFFLNRSV